MHVGAHVERKSGPAQKAQVSLSSSRIGYVEHQYISRATSRQLVHDRRYVLLRHHGADGHPLRVLESRDGRRPLPGRDLGGRLQAAAGDVVLAEDELLRGWIG